MIVDQKNILEISGMLRARREELGLDVRTVANRAGLARQTIYYAEISRDAPRLSTLLLIADALGMEIEIREKRG
jgi:transcriptional regulator with XRE-family HTH domain